MILSVAVIALLAVQRISELFIARRNTRRLMDQGAVETGANHYPFMILLHGAWLVGLAALAWDRPINLALLVVIILLQAARFWVLLTLGARWTTRIITLPGAPLVTKGPYRFISHPNYVVVVLEIALIPLAFGLVWFALIFSILNALMLWVRIRAESRALRAAKGSGELVGP